MFVIVGILLLVAVALLLIALILGAAGHPRAVVVSPILVVLAVVAIALGLILQIFVLTSGAVWSVH
jgi:hypothetical protein